jgi:hypothetical protein
MSMIEKVHDHIIDELDTNTRTDLIFVLTGIVLNLIILGVNSGIASSGGGNGATNTIFGALVVLLLVVNLVAEVGLMKGRQTRKKLLEGILKMYKDQGVEGYYDPSLLGDYRVRYNLFMSVVLAFGLVALIIPFVLRLL